jgi:transcriptional regulator with GAF, ATPase, and Fis domain
VPFYSGEVPIGTVWAIAHTDQKSFDNEDKRVMTSLSRFASAAVKNLERLRLLRENTSRLAEESQHKTEFLATIS